MKTKAIAACMATMGLSTMNAAAVAGADVILGELAGPQVYARAGGVAAITVGTTSCNAGNLVLNWKALPDNKHPVITINMYRLLEDRFTQIGQSWAKHGFVALQQNVCNFGCVPNPGGGSGLGVGCSDPYGSGNNQGPDLGSRRLVNPVTGQYDGLRAAQELGAFQPTSPIDHGLQVKENDLATPGARYFIEGQYIAPDDAQAGNGHNNVSHAEVRVTQNAAGDFLLDVVGATVRETPAIRAWPYAEFAVHESALEDGRIVVASKVTRVSRVRYRYEYAVYNMTSERGVRSFSIPLASAVSNVGMSAVASHGESWSNSPWVSTVANGRMTWATNRFDESENSNAIRWGTTYNFWFESEAPPGYDDAEFVRFKPGAGAPSFTLRVQAPK